LVELPRWRQQSAAELHVWGFKVCYPHLPFYVKGIYISEDTVKEMLLNAGSQTFLVNIMFSWWVAWAMNVLFSTKISYIRDKVLGGDLVPSG